MTGTEQGAVRVAFQGERGAFSEEAIRACFGGGAMPVPCRDFPALAEAVTSGAAQYGLLPVENSIAGGVAAAHDVLATMPLEIVGEVVQPIRLCLLGVRGATREGVRRVLSHPVALAQCQAFLGSLPAAEAIAVHDTAGAARMVAQRGERESAAVAGRIAAEIYGLDVLAEDVQDRADNQTRFFMLARPGTAPPATTRPAGIRRTALLLSTAHRPGALVDALLPFSEAGINLSRIESRPAAEPWHYNFFLEIDADATDPDTARAIERAAARARELRTLGSFVRYG
jgi:prephenate dehydratase